ncbi:ORF6N domain-containing protein [Acidithiobacillus thiooxidans]|uniref:KilA-N DNA-binding domain-containing protein n=2 Tax=Acidithiobacillus thiooxidans TaxID=930 RepID=A0A1C2I3N4_ACITH|nr:ORF6N domain-containing protein [Acidithiobacillus thiooxidans]MBU2834428.1 ORF6N domain-containing protein [Acidithiobacillus thiooxidans]OCX70605.1 hypothetical protein A6M23_13800 [Acidithiobacillus thiooxidans]OCX82953.1 hypothetical protein A6P08_11290 [Acidithiobacillus thiooxidans]QFX96687.1 hypothetical protein GCD22_02497 [Acidithiobacillus thiooxidans ATCC 19377]
MKTVTVANQNFPIVEYHGQRVITFAMIDQVHQRPERTAREAFRRNRERFIEETDFYVIDYSKKHVLHAFGIEVPPRGLTLLTESGYLMLVKSFTDDLAWQVQRELVNGYFRAKALAGAEDRSLAGCQPRLKFPHLLAGFYKGTTLARLTRMERELVGQGVHAFGMEPEQARTRALPILQERFGADPEFLFRGLPIIVPEEKAKRRGGVKALSVVATATAEVIEISAHTRIVKRLPDGSVDEVVEGNVLSPTEIARKLGVKDGAQMNRILESVGLQKKKMLPGGNSTWQPTEKGEPFVVWMEKQNLVPLRYFRWKEKPLLAFLQSEDTRHARQLFGWGNEQHDLF